jgi:hypothetical protein
MTEKKSLLQLPRQITPAEAASIAAGQFVFVAGNHHNCKQACCNSKARHTPLKASGWVKGERFTLRGVHRWLWQAPKTTAATAAKAGTS